VRYEFHHNWLPRASTFKRLRPGFITSGPQKQGDIKHQTKEKKWHTQYSPFARKYALQLLIRKPAPVLQTVSTAMKSDKRHYGYFMAGRSNIFPADRASIWPGRCGFRVVSAMGMFLFGGQTGETKGA
jgi:hypothetical protein